MMTNGGGVSVWLLRAIEHASGERGGAAARSGGLDGVDVAEDAVGAEDRDGADGGGEGGR
jgi:hypothetical protein